MKPKLIKLRYKTAQGHRNEVVLEDIVYLEVNEPAREISSEKALFIIDLNYYNAIKHNVGID
jgi:hypothetical protein